MKKPWSISTTVRSPERLRAFLRVLKTLEGQKFDKSKQEEFQIRLIKERLYSPTKISQKYKEIFDDPSKELSLEIAKDIFKYQKYKDPPMRGRQSANPLNKLGFCIARENYESIKITPLGNLFLSEDYNISKVFLKSLLRLQFPNLWSERFGEESGFNISPFITLLHLIKKTDYLTQSEFSYFVPTLTDYKEIDKYAKIILRLRKEKTKSDKDKVVQDFLKKFYQTKNPSLTQINNLFDYGDNIMRYFRLTKYFRFIKNTLGGWKIDFEPARIKEISQLLNIYDGSIKKFDKLEDYLEYLSDITLPRLPWEIDINKSVEIVISLRDLLNKEYSTLANLIKISLKKDFDSLSKKDVSKLDMKEVDVIIEQIRLFRLKISQIKEGENLRRNLVELKRIIFVLKDKQEFRKVDPTEFEYLIFQTLKILDDEINIKTNSILDDEGKPIGFAPGSKPDIEGFYQTFNAIFEVTLDTSRSQVYRESMPIMRHLRDFENGNLDKESYCVFISPRIHEDTNNYFWFSVKHGYEGKKQKIVSLDLPNYIDILESFILAVEGNKNFNHKRLKEIFEKIISNAEIQNSSTLWLGNISANIQEWKKEILA